MKIEKNTNWKMVLVFLAVILGFQSVEGQKTGSRSEVLESFSTKAGVLKLIRTVDHDIGETNWSVFIGRKRLYRTHDDVFGSVNFHTVFKGFADGEAVLMQETFMPGTCALRIIHIPTKGKPNVTDRFGFCEPLIMQDGKRIVFSFVGKTGAKPGTWTYQNGMLTNQ